MKHELQLIAFDLFDKWELHVKFPEAWQVVQDHLDLALSVDSLASTLGSSSHRLRGAASLAVVALLVQEQHVFGALEREFSILVI